MQSSSCFNVQFYNTQPAPKGICLQTADDSSGILVSLSLSSQVTSQSLALGQGVKDGSLDSKGVLVQSHMSQHHDGGKEESGWVSESHTGDIWCGSVDSLEDRALVTNVTGWGKTKTTNETGAHVGKNVTVKVRHDHDLVVVWSWVSGDLQAGVVEKLRVELDLWELLGDLVGGVEEETIRHLHDGGLVNSADLELANVLSVLESKSKDTLGSISGDKLNGLNDTINDGVLNTGVFSLGVLSDQDGVDVIVWGLVAGDRSARSDVGEEVEGTTEGKVKGNMSLSNWGL